jgi:hypothetical protein
MKKLLLICATALFGFGQAHAQLDADDYGFLNHVSFGVSAGTTGIGFQLAAPLSASFAVRAGYSFMPKFKYSKDFSLSGNTGAFTKDRVDIEGKLNMGDFSLLFDWYPSKKSSFRFTAGFFAGNKTLVEVNNKEAFVKDNYKGKAGIELGEYNPANPQSESRYTMMTDAEGNVKAELKVNSFKPYLGIGFGRAVPRKRIGLQLDLGVQFWGKPELESNFSYVDRQTGENVTRYEAIKKNRITNQDKDYQDLKDAVKTIQKIGVYPVLNLRINGRIF